MWKLSVAALLITCACAANAADPYPTKPAAARGRLDGRRPLREREHGYDLLRGFTPVSLIESSPFVLVVKQALPVRNVAEFIALAHTPAR